MKKRVLGYEVWCPCDGETRADARVVEAHEHEEAAELWAALDDRSGDGRIVGGASVEVIVLDETGDESAWTVRGEYAPQYYAWPS